MREETESWGKYRTGNWNLEWGIMQISLRRGYGCALRQLEQDNTLLTLHVEADFLLFFFVV
jgi:hypothetical protein